MNISRNSARCLDCKVEIESRYRHHFVTCPCGNISVDGGRAYLKRSFKSERWIDTSITTGRIDDPPPGAA